MQTSEVGVAGKDEEAVGRDLMLALARKAAVGDMSGAIAHELASVMQSLYGAFAAIDAALTEEQRADEDVADAVEDVQYACNHVVGLYRALRSLLHGDATVGHPVDLDAVVRKALSVCSGVARGCSELRYEPPNAEALVDGNRVLLQQVVVSLVRCSISDRSRGIPVDVSIAVAEDRVELRVAGDSHQLPESLRQLSDFDGLNGADDQEGADFDLACAGYILGSAGATLELTDGALVASLGRVRDA